MALSEFELIERYFKKAPRSSGIIISGGDDAAIIRPIAGQDLVQCMDTMVEGRHFDANTPAHAIGYKLVAVNFSDLAAMGAQPQSFQLALTLPHVNPSWLERFSQGLFECADAFNAELIGGDTTSGATTLSVLANGSVPHGQAIPRSGARPGELIYVSGHLGGASAALTELNNHKSPAPDLLRSLHYPTARVALGQGLRPIATACIDLSDGLAADLGKLLNASGIGGTVHTPRLPLHPNLNGNTTDAVQHALTGGDDYELCFCVPPDKANQVEALHKQLGLALTVIGETHAAREFTIVDGNQNTVQLAHTGWDHFPKP